MNNKFNFNQNINQSQINASLMGARTNSAIKFLIVILLGLVPLLICSYFITANGMEGDFHQWGKEGSKHATVFVDYGVMWLIGLTVYFLIFPIIYLLTKLTNEVKLDVIPSTSAVGLAMLNMFVIPHTSAYFLILSLPCFALIGFIIGMIVMISLIVANINTQMKKMQNDPNIKKMMDQLQNGGLNNPNVNKKNKDLSNNPYVDIPGEDEEKDEL